MESGDPPRASFGRRGAAPPSLGPAHPTATPVTFGGPPAFPELAPPPAPLPEEPSQLRTVAITIGVVGAVFMGGVAIAETVRAVVCQRSAPSVPPDPNDPNRTNNPNAGTNCSYRWSSGYHGYGGYNGGYRGYSSSSSSSGSSSHSSSGSFSHLLFGGFGGHGARFGGFGGGG